MYGNLNRMESHLARNHDSCPPSLIDLYEYHFNKKPPIEDRFVHKITGVWWNNEKIKCGMALKVSHPCYPSLWYLKKLQDLGYLESIDNVNYYRDHYMIISKIFLFPKSGEIVLTGPQFQYHTNNDEEIRTLSGLLKLFPYEGSEITIRLQHIKKITYITKIRNQYVVVKHWNI